VAPGAVAAAETSDSIEEILVTSRRRTESSQDVPLAVTAFSEEDIDRIKPDTLRDMDGQMPNVFIGGQTAGPSMGAIFIRGLGYQDVEKNIPPAVGLIIDDVYLGTNTGQLIDMFDVEQMEVNRGPQGVLYGKNTTGGTIVVKRVRPEFNDWGFDFSGEVGNFDRMNLKGRINIPIVNDTLALKLGAILKERDGYYDNIVTGDPAGDVDYQAYTAALRWAPTETFQATLTYDHLKDRSDSVAMDARYNGDDPFVNENDWDAQTQYDQDMLGLVMDWNINDSLTLSSITGWIDSEDYVEQDFDSATLASIDDSVSPTIAPEPLAQLHTIRDSTYEQFSQELRLSGDFNENVRFTAGGFYWDSEINLDQTTNAIAQLGNFTQTPGFPGGPQTCAQFGDFFTGLVPGFIFPHQNPDIGDSYCTTPYAPDPSGDFGPWLAGLSLQDAAEKIKSYALFGSIDWDVTDTLELSGGVRYIDEEKKFRNDYASAGLPPPAGFPVSDKESWDDVIFRFTASWAMTDNNRLYASYSEGFRSGGFSIRANNPDQLTYEPEDVKAYEIGSKNDFLEGRLRLNATAFFTEMKGGQWGSVIQDPFQAPGTNTVINNSDKTEIYGLEIDGVALLGDFFTVVGQVGLQDAERKAYFEDSSRVGVPPLGTAGDGSPILLPDQPLARTPDWNWSLAGIFDRQFGRTGVNASVTVRGQDDFSIVTNVLTGESTFGQEGYTMVDARLALYWNLNSGDVLQVALWGKNLGDKEYKEFELPLGDTGGFQGWGAPQTYGLELRWSR
jgi:iron complex outermembrane receptor protein